ncbi:hypothetical protein QYE76_054646 [Lolium multiflorum]|uniref:Uncharacterized protein n=1 Tax=Lolium multiflorum TaxID=4521 RepID=A0AAD8WL25_LOLMU|nr:hypothetical protein QYE76_054646 [Lolium multiflorum]
MKLPNTESRREGPRGPTHGGGAVQGRPVYGGPDPFDAASSPIKAPDLSLRYGKATVRETFRAAAIAKPRSGDRSLFHAAGTGNASTELWRIIEEGYSPRDPKSLTRREVVDDQLNATAINMIHMAVTPKDRAHIRSLKTAKEAWDKLDKLFLGNESIQSSRFDEVNNMSDNFVMNEGETPKKCIDASSLLPYKCKILEQRFEVIALDISKKNAEDLVARAHNTRKPNLALKMKMEPNEPINTKFYQLGNGGSLIFEHDLNAVSDFLGRPHPEFHGVQLDDTPGGELQWVITADLRGKMEPPTSERILFSFRESNWLDGLARGLQEALARLCGQNVVRILASRFAHLVRRDAMGVPMELQPHPELRHHAEHLDFMLYQTQKDLDATRAYANQTHAHIIEQGEAIKLLNNDRKSLRQQRAKKDATIVRLRAKIASLEATVKAQEDQLREMEDDDGGIDLQGGGAFLSDDDDFEEDEFTEEEDYEFLEAGPDDYVPIDVEDEE